ncbi:MAG TPA: hypothetical protein VKB17_09980 [Thermoleophilaceae bacterium]|nr:hypothetical protein [Thermoleophilaceae bacterium]
MSNSGTELKVEVVPWGPAPHALRAAADEVLEPPLVRQELGDAEHRLLAVAPDSNDSGLVRATIYDYTHERAVLVDAAVDGQPVAVRSSSRQPPPKFRRVGALADGPPEQQPADERQSCRDDGKPPAEYPRDRQDGANHRYRAERAARHDQAVGPFLAGPAGKPRRTLL